MSLQKLVNHRKAELKLSRNKLHEVTGITYSVLQAIESGKNENPTLLTLARLAFGLKVDVIDLFLASRVVDSDEKVGSSLKEYLTLSKLDWGGTKINAAGGEVLKLDHLGTLDRVLSKITGKVTSGEMTDEEAQKRLDQFFTVVEKSWEQFEEILDS